MAEVIYGGYVDEKGNTVTQEMTNISGIQTIITKVEKPNGTVDKYVDKALDSNMKEYAKSRS